MAQKDILLRAGITFNANDIDTKAISNAITKAVSSTALNIKKANFSKDAKTSLKNKFEQIAFRINKSTFGRSGQTSIRQKFKEIVFSIGAATFSATALKQLNSQLGLNKFKLNQIQQRQQKQRGGTKQQSAGQTASSTTSTRSFNTAIKEQGLLFNRSLQDIQAYNAVIGDGDKKQLAFQKTIAQGGQSLEGFGANIAKITTRFTAYLASLRAIFLVQQAFSKSLEVIVKFDATLQDLNKVLDETPEGLEDVSAGLFRVAEATGQSVFAVAESFGVFRRAVDDNEEALRRTSAALVAVNISELTVAESTRFVTSSMNIFGSELQSEIEALDILSVTADNAATTAAQLGRGVLRSGAAAEAVGVSFKQLSALIAATEEATKLGGAQIGSALKTIFARLASNSAELRRNANALGGNLKASDSVFESLQKLNDLFPGLNREQKAQLTQIVAGKRRFTEFNAIISSFNKTQELLGKQADASGTALRKNEEELDTLQVAAQQLRNQFSKLIVTLSGADQGADAAATLREAIASVLDIVTSGTKAVNTFISTFGGLENLGAALTGTFITLVKVGLFKVGPAVLGSLVAGAKAFLGIGQKITSVIAASTGALNAEQTAQKGVVDQQGIILSQLEKEKIIREEIAKINKQFVGSGLPTGGGGGAGRFGSEFQQQQERAQRGRLGRLLDSAGVQIKKGTKAIRNGLGRARDVINKNGIGVALAVGTAASAVNAFADDIDKTNNGVATLSTNLTRVTAGAAQSAISFGLLLGPLGALGAGIFSVTKGLLDLVVASESERIIREESINSIESSTEGFASSLAIAGSDGERIFKSLVGEGQSLNNAVVKQTVFFDRLTEEINNGTTAFQKFANNTSQALDELSKSIEGNSRAQKLQQNLDKVSEGIRKKVLSFDLEADTGNLTGAFKEVANLSTEINAQSQQFRSQVSAENTELDIKRRLLSTAKELRDGEAGTVEEIVKRNLVTNDTIRDQVRLLEETRRSVRSQNDEFESQERTVKDQLTAIDFVIQRVQDLQEARKAEGATQEEIGAREQSITNSLRARAVLENDLVATAEKINILQSEEAKLTRQVNETIQEQAKGIANFEVLEAKRLEGLKLINVESAKNVQNIKDQISLSQETLSVRQQIARQQLSGGSLAERQEAEIAAIREQQNQRLRQTQAQQIRNIASLRSAALVAINDQERASLEAAANIAEANARTEIDTLTQQAEIQIELRLIDVNKKQIEQAEGALQQFKLNNIQQLLDREVDFASKRIELVKELQDTQAGRQLLKEEFSPQPGLERQFGFLNAVIVESLTSGADAATKAVLKEFDELRVGGVFAVEDLAKASEAFFQAEQNLANLRKSGAGTEEIIRAESNFNRVKERLEEISNSGADAFERLQFVQAASAQIIQQEEQRTAEIRKLALERAQEAAEQVANAEKKLIEERNKIPALNSRVIAANKALSQAQSRVGDATTALIKANQDLGDEQFKLAFNVGLAEIRARTATGSLSGAADQIGALADAFNSAAAEAAASADAILEVRRRLLQQELSLIESQLQSVQSLAFKAATADAGEIAKLQQAGAAAAQISAGQAQIADFPPEIIQSLGEFKDFFPGLERAILEFGAERLGIDPSVFQSFEDRLVELNTGIAETGQSQVDAAQDNVRAAQAQLEETRQQKDLAQNTLDVAVSQRDAAFQAVAQAGANLNVTRAGFSQLTQQTARTLNEFRFGRIASESASTALDLLRKAQESALAEIDAQKLVAQETLGLTKEQTVAIDETKTEQIATKDKIAEGVQKQEETNILLSSTKSVLEDMLTAIGRGQGVSGAIATGIESFAVNANGNLRAGEISGIMSAASREKRAMPTGSRLMLANTSETVIPRKTVKRIKRASGGHIPNAQGGNSTGDIENAVATLAAETNSLRRSINDLARNINVQGPVQVNLDTNRTITVNGLNELPQAIESVIAQRLGGTPSQEEVTAIRQSIVDVLNRLRENGLEDFSGLGV